MKIRLGTRSSALAQAQSGWVADRIRELEPGITIDKILIETGGDQDQVTPLHEVGSPGVFTAEVERALARDEIDVAVHSLKDLPIEQPPELLIAAIPLREDPLDVWISAEYPGLVDVPAGAVVATGSLRRSAQILHKYPHLQIAGIRGNVETRIRLHEERGDAGLVLASAGLRRLGIEDRIRCSLSATEVTPAPGQGALAVEVRSSHEELISIISRLDDLPTRRCVAAERGLLAAFGGGCHLPVGAHAVISGDQITICGALGLPDGSRLIRLGLEGACEEYLDLGAKLADLIKKAGGDEILTQLDARWGK